MSVCFPVRYSFFHHWVALMKHRWSDDTGQYCLAANIASVVGACTGIVEPIQVPPPCNHPPSNFDTWVAIHPWVFAWDNTVCIFLLRMEMTPEWPFVFLRVLRVFGFQLIGIETMLKLVSLVYLLSTSYAFLLAIWFLVKFPILPKIYASRAGLHLGDCLGKYIHSFNESALWCHTKPTSVRNMPGYIKTGPRVFVHTWAQHFEKFNTIFGRPSLY